MTIRYTNHHGMPEALAKAVELDSKHTAGDISVTQLIDPPRIRQLVERHDVEIDVSEMLWALLGKAIHKVIEPYVEQAEVQLVAEVDGVRVSGTIDEISGGLLRDWKMTSVWTVVFGGKAGRKEWENQLNLYAWLCETAGIDATTIPHVKWKPVEIKEGLRACMVFRDWTRSKVGGKGYPDKQWSDATVELWPREVRDEYLRSRLALHMKAAEMDTKDLPLCEPEERWIRERDGKEVRCLDYCPARSVCDHALALKEMAGA